jgi:hypothetical protein
MRFFLEQSYVTTYQNIEKTNKSQNLEIIVLYFSRVDDTDFPL